MRKTRQYKQADLKHAKWISTGGVCNTPLIRKNFILPSIKQAKILVAGLGFYEIYVNGQKISEDKFLSLSTDYQKRTGIIFGGIPFQEKLGHRLYCPEYDITSFLKEGENSICIMMGPGWCELVEDSYGVGESCGFGKIKLSYLITYEDGCGKIGYVASDEHDRWKRSFIKKGGLLQGETHDYRGYEDYWMHQDYEISSWKKVAIEPAPETNFYIQDSPADRVILHVNVKYIFEEGNRRIYDAGEMMTGYPVFVSKAPAGTQIKVRYAECLNDQGQLEEEHIYGQHSDFITDGTLREMHSKFTWLCFRYFEVTGDAEVVDCQVIHSDVAVNSSFTCDIEVLNWVREAYIRTQLNNMHCGLPSDCPHIERRGYTGDGQLTCQAAMTQLDAESFYRKWIYDISDCQDRKSGHIQYTAPFFPSGGGAGGWGCAIVMVPYAYYKYYGDSELIRMLYPQMLFWFEWMEKHSEDDLVVSDLENVWCLGDWCVPAMEQENLDGILLPAPLVNTYFYIRAMEYVLELGDALNLHGQDELLKKRIADKKDAIIRHYYDAETGDFAGNVQGSNAYAVDLGLGDERTFANMIQLYTDLQKYDTGIFGTDILTRVLFEHGQEELAIALLTSQEDSTFYAQMKNGHTSLLEYWDGMRSQCHPMFGAVTKYLFEYILGIRQAEKSVGYQKVMIEPKCMNLVRSANGHMTTPFGIVSVEYDNEKIEVTIPEGVKATLVMNDDLRDLHTGVNKFVK